MKLLRVSLVALAIASLTFTLATARPAHAASVYTAYGNNPPQPPVAQTIPSYYDPTGCVNHYFGSIAGYNYLAEVYTSANQIFTSQKVLTTFQQLYNAGYDYDAACSILLFGYLGYGS